MRFLGSLLFLLIVLCHQIRGEKFLPTQDGGQGSQGPAPDFRDREPPPEDTGGHGTSDGFGETGTGEGPTSPPEGARGSAARAIKDPLDVPRQKLAQESGLANHQPEGRPSQGHQVPSDRREHQEFRVQDSNKESESQPRFATFEAQEQEPVHTDQKIPPPEGPEAFENAEAPARNTFHEPEQEFRRTSPADVFIPERCPRCARLKTEPICGTDGKTYDNKCFLFCRNVQNNDVSRCRVSRAGNEYRGFVNVTRSGLECSSWISHQGVYTPHRRTRFKDPIIDDNFPDRSLLKARNYCRNPDHGRTGLWCYTGDREPRAFDFCDVPRCRNLVDVDYVGTCRSRQNCVDRKDSISCVELSDKGYCGTAPQLMDEICYDTCNQWFCQSR